MLSDWNKELLSAEIEIIRHDIRKHKDDLQKGVTQIKYNVEAIARLRKKAVAYRIKGVPGRVAMWMTKVLNGVIAKLHS